MVTTSKESCVVREIKPLKKTFSGIGEKKVNNFGYEKTKLHNTV